MTTTLPLNPVAFVQSATTDLHQLVNQLSISTMPFATRRRSFILNDIPGEIYVNTDVQALASILGNILNTVICQSNDSCIHITAKAYGDVILVHLKDSHNLNVQKFNASLDQTQRMAEKLGGTITINNFRNETTSIALSFMNLPLAA